MDMQDLELFPERHLVLLGREGQGVGIMLEER